MQPSSLHPRTNLPSVDRQSAPTSKSAYWWGLSWTPQGSEEVTNLRCTSSRTNVAIRGPPPTLSLLININYAKIRSELRLPCRPNNCTVIHYCIITTLLSAEAGKTKKCKNTISSPILVIARLRTLIIHTMPL